MKGEAAGVHFRCLIHAKPADVPRLIGVARDGFGALRVADDEAVLPAIRPDPLAFGRVLEAFEPEAVARAGEVGGSAELVFAMSGVGARAFGVVEATLGDVLLERQDLLIVAAVAAGGEDLEAGFGGVGEHAFERLGGLGAHELRAARRNCTGERDEIRRGAVPGQPVLLVERRKDVATGDDGAGVAVDGGRTIGGCSGSGRRRLGRGRGCGSGDLRGRRRRIDRWERGHGRGAAGGIAALRANNEQEHDEAEQKGAQR